MIKYSFYQKNPASHYIYIDLFIDAVNSHSIQLQLPAWRPGRYELGNFAKNVKRLDAFNQDNVAIEFTKLTKDLWEVNTANCSSVKITYSYYAAELNAGACYVDAKQVYVNPVHTCLAVKGREMEEHRIELKIPETYKLVSSMKMEANTMIAADFEELVDSPFMASATLKSDYYEVNGIKFWLHFNGECKPDWQMFKKDFSAFTKKQMEFWNDAPFDEYHFLFQILPFRFYHGVEHKKNTVIAIGPGYALNTGDTYEDVLGVSCHELFHAWNIKTIRPVEMLPYNYTRENYARTGYVYEGFTTYYGDKLLLGSGVFTNEPYLKTLQERLLKHFHNYGRYNLSVAHSSWETWLDGYVPGAPYRKTNIYDEGNLIALMLDTRIMAATSNKKCLRDVCVLLYERFGKKTIGYTEQDIIDLVNEVSGQDFTEFFRNFVYTANDFELPLNESFSYLGLEFTKQASQQVNEHYFGFKVVENGNFSKVSLVAPYSPAWKAGLFNGDEIMAVNGIMLKNNLNHWLKYFIEEDEIQLTVNSNENVNQIVLSKDKKGNTYFFNPILKLKTETTESEVNNFKEWLRG